ncbi:MAG: hypothetical protein QOD42_2963 [Sphingomonadales bacterium]|jgi:hypothetical protein|nr:hypothetical protein [Sphingomonadales bacterium]
MADDGELRGVGGWLATFVVILAVISPLFSIFQVYQALYADPVVAAGYAEAWTTIQAFEWSLVAVCALAAWFAAYRLVSVHNWLSVKIAIFTIWAIAIGGTVAELAGVSWITGLSAGLILAEGGTGLIVRPIIFCLIWTTYLLRSERVANTYRGSDGQAEVFE